MSTTSDVPIRPDVPILSAAQGLLRWSNVNDWMLTTSGHDLGYESQAIVGAGVTQPKGHPEVVEFERAMVALRLELPDLVWRDVWRRWMDLKRHFGGPS